MEELIADFSYAFVFCTLRVILKGPAAGKPAVEERTARFPARSFLRASQNVAMEEHIATFSYALFSARFA